MIGLRGHLLERDSAFHLLQSQGEGPIVDRAPHDLMSILPSYLGYCFTAIGQLVMRSMGSQPGHAHIPFEHVTLGTYPWPLESILLGAGEAPSNREGINGFMNDPDPMPSRINGFIKDLKSLLPGHICPI